MRLTYLLADKELDQLFGFKTELALSLPGTPREGIKSLIDMAFYKDPLFGEYREPTIRDVFVVDSNEDGGLVGVVNLDTRQRLYADDVNPRRNPKIRLNGTYVEELTKYLDAVGAFDKIVVARSEISPQVRRDIERLVPEAFRRIAINLGYKGGHNTTPNVDVGYTPMGIESNPVGRKPVERESKLRRIITENGLKRNVGKDVVMIDRRNSFGHFIEGRLSHEDDTLSLFGGIKHTGTGRPLVMAPTYFDGVPVRGPCHLQNGERIRIKYEPKSPRERTREIDYVVDLK